VEAGSTPRIGVGSVVTARVRVDSIAAGGDGVARSDGMAVFIPRTAPGDLVDISLELRGRFARGSVSSIVESSANRTEPRCPHYTRDRCGGCQLQHMTYASQLRAKATIVRDAMQRIGKRPVEAVPVHPSPSPWHYRTKLTLALRRSGDHWMAGLHRYDDPDAIFSLEQCPITDDRVVAIWHEILRAGAHLPRARQLRGAVRLTDDGASFVLEGGREWPAARELADQIPSLTSVWWDSESGHRRLMVDRRVSRAETLATSEKAPDASFVQVNTAAATMLHSHVLSLVLARAPETVVDAYAGSGATAIALANHGAVVTAIELDPAAGRWVAAHLPRGSRSVIGRVEDSLEDVLPADVVILNPPRTGVDERVTAILQQRSASAIVYVSCNPATLARDVQRMPGYRIASLTSFDMFPQTAHVETVCELVREAA
jgi:23S rRNA (uracil1939-C5)-methyltransferase